MTIMNRLKLLILSLFLLTACANEEIPEGVLDQQKMVNVLTDMTVIDGYMSTLMYTDTLRTSGKNYYATVYKNHNISKAAFDKSLKYYSMQPALLDSMYTKVTKKLEAKEKTLNKIQMQEQIKTFQKAPK